MFHNFQKKFHFLRQHIIRVALLTLALILSLHNFTAVLVRLISLVNSGGIFIS